MNIILSSTQLDEILSCERKFNFERNLGLQIKTPNPKAQERNYKRDRGTLFHKLLEKYYKAKLNKIAINEDLIIAIMNWGRAEGSTTLNLTEEHTEKTVRKFRDYCIEYKHESYIIEGVEESYNKELYSSDKHRIALEGNIDLRVTNSQNMKILVDHKSGSWDLGFLTNQFMCYCFLSGYRIVVENKCAIDGPGFSRPMHSYTDRLLGEWKQSTVKRILYIIQCQEENDYPPDFTRCKEFGGCQFYELCSQDPEHRAAMIQSEFVFVEDSHYKERFTKESE